MPYEEKIVYLDGNNNDSSSIRDNYNSNNRGNSTYGSRTGGEPVEGKISQNNQLMTRNPSRNRNMNTSNNFNQDGNWSENDGDNYDYVDNNNKKRRKAVIYAIRKKSGNPSNHRRAHSADNQSWNSENNFNNNFAPNKSFSNNKIIPYNHNRNSIISNNPNGFQNDFNLNGAHNYNHAYYRYPNIEAFVYPFVSYLPPYPYHDYPNNYGPIIRHTPPPKYSQDTAHKTQLHHNDSPKANGDDLKWTTRLPIKYLNGQPESTVAEIPSYKCLAIIACILCPICGKILFSFNKALYYYFLLFKVLLLYASQMNQESISESKITTLHLQAA